MNEEVKHSYKEHLFDKRWRSKRELILERDNHRCQCCGETKNLVVHHKQYHITREGKKLLPWMYDDKYLVTLCEACHRKGHSHYDIPVKYVDSVIY